MTGGMTTRIASHHQSVPSDNYYWRIVPASRRDGGTGYMVENWFLGQLSERHGPVKDEVEARKLIECMDNTIIGARHRVRAALEDLGRSMMASLREMADKLAAASTRPKA